MKLGCTSAAYRSLFREGRMDLRAWLRTCAEDLDVDGVEFDLLDLPSVEGRDLREIKHLCTSLHLTIAGVALTTELAHEPNRATESERIRQSCDVAAYLGAPVLRITTGTVPATQARREEPGRIVGLFRRVFGERTPDRKRLWSDVMWALRSCADYAGERGVTLAVQNESGNALIDHGPALAQAVRDVGSPWLRAALDPAALSTPAGMDLALRSTVQLRLLLRRISDDGADAAFRWPEALHAVALGHYRGFALLDYAGAEDPTTALPRAARYIRGLLHLLQRQQLLQADHEPHTNGRSPADAASAVRSALTPAGARDR